MFEQLFFGLVNNVLDLSYRHAYFFSEWFVTDTIKQVPFEDVAVSFCIFMTDNPLVDGTFEVIS